MSIQINNPGGGGGYYRPNYEKTIALNITGSVRYTPSKNERAYVMFNYYGVSAFTYGELTVSPSTSAGTQRVGITTPFIWATGGSTRELRYFGSPVFDLIKGVEYTFSFTRTTPSGATVSTPTLYILQEA